MLLALGMGMHSNQKYNKALVHKGIALWFKCSSLVSQRLSDKSVPFQCKEHWSVFTGDWEKYLSASREEKKEFSSTSISGCEIHSLFNSKLTYPPNWVSHNVYAFQE